MTGAPDATPDRPDPAARRGVARAAAGLAAYAGVFGATFGAVSVATGFSLAQTVVLSLVMFSGASQFAFVGVVGGGGAPAAGIAAALLLGARNAFYGVPVSRLLRTRGPRRLVTAHLVIDETTAMAVGQPTPALGRHAFWTTGVSLFAAWQLGTLVGALVGESLDPATLGLDAAAPAVFLALLWPQLRQRTAPVVALLGGLVALALLPVAPAGVPVVAAAGVAVLVGLVRS